MRRFGPGVVPLLAALPLVLLLVGAEPRPATAEAISDVRNTKHNLSASSGNTVRAVSESQVCVFCHTPHGAAPDAAPLWNRRTNTGYKVYSSSSLDANAIQAALDQPGGSSKLCLSCHDGTIAIGSVNVLNGVGSATAQGTVKIDMQGVPALGGMPDGPGAGTGFTRNLGMDLTNDHPVSVSYTNALALRDGELRVVDAGQNWPPGDGSIIANRGTGARPKLPLEPAGTGGVAQVQCATCHDPHRRELDTTKGNQKFLRANRFQEQPATPTYSADNDIICLSCHDKNNGITGSWAYSAHANSMVATQTYQADAARQREFPAGQPVWKASCLNCHDTHTVQGSRRLLREGTDSASTPKGAGNPAIEETCWQCHAAGQATVTATGVPDIKTDFNATRHMPIRNAEQGSGSEAHDIAGNFTDTFLDCSGLTNGCGKDFVEPRAKLGAGALSNRHAECTDCHNPHRVVKFAKFYGSGGSLAGAGDAKGTHTHAAGVAHDNIASGVLRGTWGVEPVYGSSSFFSLPGSYTVKRGDPGSSTDTTSAAGHVTREYQVCLKCHSDYGYTDDNVLPSGNTRPPLGAPGTPSPRTNFTRHTNQAREFQPNDGAGGTGAGSSYVTNNHRGWHPVVGPTGRSGSTRGNGTDISNNWRAPFNAAVGTQTIYCSDCHGSAVSSTTDVVPTSGVWGPHGSANDFILKGAWNGSSGAGSGGDTGAICFKCHQQQVYAPTSGGGGRTGFWATDKSKDGHYIHSDRDRMSGKGSRCNWCHVAVPHGWKNKALLVNLNDTGPEVGNAGNVAIADGSLPYTNGPYYRNAMLKVKRFKASGQWTQSDCGAVGSDSGTWMKDVCKPRAP